MAVSSPYCPKCGGKNTPEAATCFACGGSLLFDADLAVTSPGPNGFRVKRALPMTSRLIRGRYLLVGKIGAGGFGAVYQAEDRELGNRRVAVKEMQPSGLAPQELEEATEAFHREALLLAGLSHPSLPRIYDHFSEDGHWYLVMDFIEGETLEQRVERAFDKHLSVKETLQLGIQLCKVLEYLHTRQPPIIFRDLKPSNVMLTSDGAVYLVDFGIARFFKPGQQKDTMAFGSPGYAAPEQYGKAQTTPRSDVFSLGALLHHLLTGSDPADTPFRFKPLTMPRPAGLGTFIGSMVNLDEHKRPPGVGVVRRELERLAANWAEGRMGHATTMAFPPYQAATGMLPAVQPGRWLPAPSGTMPPAQMTGATRTAGPVGQYPPFAPISPLAGSRRARQGTRWWTVLVVALLIGLCLVLFLGVALLAYFSTSRHRYPPSGPSDPQPTSTIRQIPIPGWSPDGLRLAPGSAAAMARVWLAS